MLGVAEKVIKPIDRPVRAPDLEWLTRHQMADWLNIGVDAFDALAEREGLLPIPLGPKTRRYTWMDAVALAHIVTRKAATEQSNTPKGSGK